MPEEKPEPESEIIETYLKEIKGDTRVYDVDTSSNHQKSREEVSLPAVTKLRGKRGYSIKK